MSKLVSSFWDREHAELRNNEKIYGRENLISWPVVQKTMFMGNPRWVAIELKFLKEMPDWNSRWKPAIQESEIGNPPNSYNLVHMAYHVALFEKLSNKRVDELDTIFEFGGGYGCMCRLIHTLGFSGKYTIYDLPTFVKLQEYYLNHFDIHPRLLSEKDLAKLETVHSFKDSLFIATWSLSEAPMDMRRMVLKQVEDFSYYLIAYQIGFEDVSNVDFFRDWGNLRTNIKWHNWEISHIPENYYMIGYKE